MTRADLRRRINQAAPYAILLALWLLFFWRYFAPPPNRVAFPDGDFTQQFFIFRDIAYRALAAGRLPLWADCLFAGYPFHADPQSQLFYPPIWLIFAALKLQGWGSFPLEALVIEAVGHYLLASIFMFLFLRAELGSRRRWFAPLLGALVFAYGGYLTGYAPLQTAILETATWLPLILLTFLRLVQYDPRSYRAWAALALAVAFFAGHPQTFLFVFYLSAAYFVCRAALAGRGLKWIALRLAAVLALFAPIISVQLLPEIQFLSLSTRPSLSFDALSGGFPLGDIVQFFVTQIVSRWHPLYVGVLPLTLAVAAMPLVRERTTRRAIAFWIAAAIIGLILSLGSHAAGYDLAYWLLPGYRLFRGQERAAILVAFPLAVLAAFGAAAYFAPLARSNRRVVIGAARFTRNLLPLALALLALVVALKTAYPDNGDLRALPERFGLLVFSLAFTSFVFYLRLAPAARRWLPMVLVAVAALELFTASIRVNAAAPFEPYPYYSFLDPMRADDAPFFRVQDDARMQGHFACGYGLKEWGGITPIRLASWDEFDRRVRESVRWKMIGMKYLITWKNGAITREDELPPAERLAEGAAPQGQAKVYRLFEIPRRAWLVSNVKMAAGSESLINALNTPGFDPFSEAVLRDSPPARRFDFGPDGGGTVDVLSDYPGHLSLSVAADSPSLLVISEAYYPGWQVTVNGLRVDLVEADGFLQAAPVPAGSSRVDVDFKPPALLVGAIAAVLGLLACAILILGGRGKISPNV